MLSINGYFVNSVILIERRIEVNEIGESQEVLDFKINLTIIGL